MKIMSANTTTYMRMTSVLMCNRYLFAVHMYMS